MSLQCCPAPRTITVFLLVLLALGVTGAVAAPRTAPATPPAAPADPQPVAAAPPEAVTPNVVVGGGAVSYFTVTPCRAFDSRQPANAPALQTGVARLVQVTGNCGVPADAKIVAVNLTMTQATSAGSIEAFPGDGTATGLAQLISAGGQTRANNAVLTLAGSGSGTLKALFSTATASQTTHFILDVNGYFKDVTPVAQDDSYNTTLNTALNQAAPGVLANDTLNGAAIFSYGATTGAEQTTIGAATPTSAAGSVTLNADGSFNYTPATGFKGNDTFKYVLKNSAGSSTATVTISVGKGNQTITFTSTAPAGAKVGGPTYNVTATASSGLTVAFTIDASAASVCSISGSTVSFIGVGTCVIDANQAGDANYNAAPQVQQSFAVAKGDQTINFTSTAPAGATVGGPTYNVTATATSGLTVAFTIDAAAASVCSISGSTVSFIGVGTCVIDANQAGDANYNAAPQAQQSFAVGKGNQTINFTSTAPASAKVGGPTYNVTATASSGLAVTFTIDAAAASVCSISGSTVSFTGAGTCVIDANQAGNANYNAAPQAQQSFAVGKADQTINFTSTAPAGAKVGGPTYTVTATATSGLTVAFTIDAAAASVCSISGSTVSFIGAGTCVIDANQAGDANYNAAPQVQQSFAVAKGDQTINFTSTAPAGAKVGGPTYNVTATASSGLAVTFTIDASASSVCSISGSTVSFIAAGTCVIDANQAGNANYNAAPQAQQSFAVAKGDQTINFTSTAPAGAKVAGPTYNVTATASSGLAVTFTIDGSASAVCSISGSTVSFIGAGTCVIDANQGGNANYNAAPQAQQSFAVAKGDQTINFTSTAPAGAKVGGPTYTVSGTASSGLAVTFTIDASAASVCSISGSTVSFTAGGTCVIDANQAGNANYNAAPQVQQSFAVAKADQTINFTSTAPTGAKIGGPTYTVSATASSGLAVAFTIDASAASVCSISGSTVSFTGGGTCVIDANQAGNASYNPAPQVQQSFHVNQPPVLANNPVSYKTPGNTQLHVAGATLPGVAAWTDSQGLLAKSGATDPDAGPGPLSVVPASGTTGNGGSYSVNADGSFTYVPATGFNGTDSFTYQVTDSATPTTGTVNITVSQRIWYVRDVVDANSPAGGDGRSTGAFHTLAPAQTAAGTGDIIFVFRGNTGTTPLAGGITLKDGQKLWGEGIGLTVPTFGTLIAAGSKPKINNSSGDAVAVPATAGDLQNVEVRGLDLAASGNGVNASATVNHNVGVTISDNDVSSAGLKGVLLTAGSTGTFTATLNNNAIAATGNAFDASTSAATTLTIDFSNNAVVSSAANGIVINGAGGGTTWIKGFANNAVSKDTAGTGISITSAKFDAVPGGAYDTVSGGTTLVGISGNGVGGAGMVLSGVSGDLAFTNFDVFASGGAGVSVSGTGAVNIGAGTGTRVTVGAGVAIVEATGGPAVNVSNATIDLQLASLKSTNSASTGVSLDTTFGTFSAGSGSTITNATGTDFNVNAGTAAVTYNGTITDTTGRLVSVTSTTGGTKSFTGAISDTGSGTGTGIFLNANTGATIGFTGTLTLSTGSSGAFTATGGGTVTATDTNSTIVTTTGTAVNVANTTIGASGLTFKTVSAGTAGSGPASGIVLNSTGSSGGLTVNGGTIQKTTSHGVSLNSTASVSLSSMTITNSAADGINGASVNGLTLSSCSITNSGGSANHQGIKLTELQGTATFTNLTVTGSTQSNFWMQNSSATVASLTFTGGTYGSTNNAFATADDGILVVAQGTSAVTTASISGTTFSSNFASGLQVQAGDTASIGDFTVSGCTFTNNGKTATDFNQFGSGNLKFHMLNNLTITGNGGPAINASSTSTASGGTLKGRIDGNHVGNAGVTGSGTTGGPGIRVNVQGKTVGTVTVVNNVVRQTPGSRGIDVEALGPVATGQPITVSDFTITGNDVDNNDTTGFALDDIYVAADNQGSPAKVRAEIHGNKIKSSAGCADYPGFSGNEPWMYYNIVTAGALAELVNFGGHANANTEISTTQTSGTAAANAGVTLIAGPINSVP